MNTIYLITSDGPQCGKTTIAKYIAGRKKLTHATTSYYITLKYSSRSGIPVDDILAARAKNHNAHRNELIAIGNEINEQGIAPAIELIKAGHQVIDGVRRKIELDNLDRWVSQNDYKLIHFHIHRDGYTAIDNTEASVLRKRANYILLNDSSIRMLKKKVNFILKFMS